MKEPFSYLQHFKRLGWPALLLAGLTGIFSSCERSEPDPQFGSLPEDHQISEPLESESSELVILTWDEYLPVEVLEQFEERNGIHVDYQTVENSEEFAQLLASRPGDFDLVIVDDGTLIELNDLDLLQPLESSLLKTFGNLNPDFLGLDFDSDNSISIPYLWGTTLIAYRKDQIPNPPRNWNQILNGTLEGRLALIDEPDDLLQIGLLALGHSPTTASPEEFEKATELLLGKLKDDGNSMLEVFDALDALDRGEISAAITYSGDAASYAAENEQIGYFIPDEGAPLWVDSFAICRTSPHAKEALQFIDFMTEAETAAATANTLRYATPNKAALPMIDEALLTNPAIYPTREVMERCNFIRLNSNTDIHFINRCIGRIFEQARQIAKTSTSAGLMPTEGGLSGLASIND